MPEGHLAEGELNWTSSCGWMASERALLCHKGLIHSQLPATEDHVSCSRSHETSQQTPADFLKHGDDYAGYIVTPARTIRLGYELCRRVFWTLARRH
jgi:hypothetical protein